MCVCVQDRSSAHFAKDGIFKNTSRLDIPVQLALPGHYYAHRYLGQFGPEVSTQPVCVNHAHWDCYALGVWHEQADRGFYQPMPTEAYQVYVQVLTPAVDKVAGCAALQPFYIQRVDGGGNVLEAGVRPVLDTDLNGNRTMEVPNLGTVSGLTMTLSEYTQRLRQECLSTAQQFGGRWVSYVRIMGDQDTVYEDQGGSIQHIILIMPKNHTPPVFQVDVQTYSGGRAWKSGFDLASSPVSRDTYEHTPGLENVEFPSFRMRPNLAAQGFPLVLMLCVVWWYMTIVTPQDDLALVLIWCVPKVILGSLLGAVFYLFGHIVVCFACVWALQSHKYRWAWKGCCLLGCCMLTVQGALCITVLFKDHELALLGIPAYFYQQQPSYPMVITGHSESWRAPVLGLWAPFMLVESLVTGIGLLFFVLLDRRPSTTSMAVVLPSPPVMPRNPYRRSEEGLGAILTSGHHYTRNRYR